MIYALLLFIVYIYYDNTFIDLPYIKNNGKFSLLNLNVYRKFLKLISQSIKIPIRFNIFLISRVSFKRFFFINFAPSINLHFAELRISLIPIKSIR